MTQHENADIYRRAFEAIVAEDFDTARGLVAADVVWHEAGNPEAIRGREAVFERFAGVGDGVDLSDVEIHGLLADDEHVCALIKATLRHGDREVSYPVVEIAHVRDGQISERWAMMDAVPAYVDEFFSRLSP